MSSTLRGEVPPEMPRPLNLHVLRSARLAWPVIDMPMPLWVHVLLVTTAPSPTTQMPTSVLLWTVLPKIQVDSQPPSARMP